MAIATSYSRNENTSDGAKVTRRTASYDDLEKLINNKIPRKAENMKHVAATKLERESKTVKLNIVCSDTISVDAELFDRESLVVQAGYKNDLGFIEVESNSQIITKVELFCAVRAWIQNYYAPEDIYDDYGKYLLQQKLDSFNSNFRQRNKSYALDLMIAACDLEIKSLIDLMMEDVDDIFKKTMTDDEVYEIFFVNLNGEYNLYNFEFEGLEDDLIGYEWAFEATQTHDAQVFLSENMHLDNQISSAATETDDADSDKPVLRADKWYLELLKVPFDRYKTLSYELRRLWLTTHFILRKLVHIPDLVSSNSKTGRNKENIELNIVCSDGIHIDAKLFERECQLVQGYYDNDGDGGFLEVESNNEIIKKVEFFCTVRAMIQDDYAHDDYLLQHKLNSFNSKFRQLNRIHALDLMIAAFRLEIKSLVDVMMEDVEDMFLNMTSEDEAYKILFVNLRGEHKRRKRESMKKRPGLYRWCF